MTRVDGTARTAQSIDTRPRVLRPERQARDSESTWSVTLPLAAGAMLLAAPVQAHLVGAGFAAFYETLTRVALTPADVLVVVALALLTSHQGTRTARWTLLAFPIAWLASGAVGARFPTGSAMPLLTTLTFACAGLLVAFDAKLRPAAVSTFAIAAGLLNGYLNGATMAWGDAGALGLAAIATATIALFAILSAQVITLQAECSRAAVRVAGNWIAAIGVLLLGWIAHSLA